MSNLTYRRVRTDPPTRDPGGIGPLWPLLLPFFSDHLELDGPFGWKARGPAWAVLLVVVLLIGLFALGGLYPIHR